MKIMSYNVNGIRSRLDQLNAILKHFQPDVIGLQEVKVHDDEFPVEAFADSGYHLNYFGQKGHYGVGIFSKQAPIAVQKGFPFADADDQRRMIAADFSLSDGRTLRVINGYYPQGEARDHPVKFPNKRKYYVDMLRYLKEECDPSQPLAVIGDMNIAPVDGDIGIGPDNAKRWLRSGKASFLPEEREWLQTLFDWGLYDSWRIQNPDVTDRFSWFDYRSRGFDREPRRGLRIDLILVTKTLMDICSETGIDYEFRGKPKPSDHCAIWADFNL